MSNNANGPTTTPATVYRTAKEEQLRGVVRTRFDSPNPTDAQLSRRARNNKFIRDLGLPVMEDLPVVEDEAVVPPRSPQEVAERCLATSFCAIKGESQDQRLVDKLIGDYGATGYFSPKERKFIEDLAPSKRDQIDFGWRYECVHVFVWSLGLREQLAGPADVCPVDDDVKAIKNMGSADFVSKARLRPAKEIFDMADLYYRLHWAVLELRLKGQQSPKANEEIIQERHRALNWLIRYMNQPWDDVSTDT